MMKMHGNWFNALKNFSLLVFVLLINARHFAYADDVLVEVSDADVEGLQIQEPDEGRMAKRAWNQLQGSWGKRSLDEVKDALQHYPSDDYLESLRNFDYEPTRLQNLNLIPDTDDYEGSQVMQKRAWKTMNTAWGKRDWSKMRNTGKREPGNWNNLRGLWGKRSGEVRSWNKLSSAWGK